VRVCPGTVPLVQTRLLAERCRVLCEPDDSRIATQQFHDEQAIPTASDREFGPYDRYARHRPIRSRALRPDSRNPGYKNRTGAGAEICTLRNFGSANAAKEYAPLGSPFSLASERGSRRNDLNHQPCFRKARSTIPSPQSSPRKRGEADVTFLKSTAKPRERPRLCRSFLFLSEKSSYRALLRRWFERVNEFPKSLGENFRAKFPIMGDSGRSNVMSKKSSPTFPELSVH